MILSPTAFSSPFTRQAFLRISVIDFPRCANVSAGQVARSKTQIGNRRRPQAPFMLSSFFRAKLLFFLFGQYSRTLIFATIF